jgi:hypothetical protein
MRPALRALCAVATFALSSTSIVACLSDDDVNGELTGVDGSIEVPDTSAPVGCRPGSTAVACVDAGHDAADVTVADTTVPDTSQPDTTVADTSQPDTNQPDTNVADTNQPDTNVADTNVPDAFDGGPAACVTSVIGDYYTRTDGALVFGASPVTVVVIDATSAPLLDVSDVFEMPYSACGLRSTDGTVWCWPTFDGVNAAGELGNGSFTPSSGKHYRATQVVISHPDGGAPVYLDQVTSLPQRSELNYATGLCAIRSDKTLWCWGPATQGALWKGTTGTTADLAFATQLKSGADAGAFIVGVDQVSLGGRHLCYLSGGQDYCFGDNTGGQLGTGDTTAEPYPFHVTGALPAVVTAVAAGQDQSCAMGAGQVWCWGADTYSSNGDPYVEAGVCNSNFCQASPVPVQATLPDGGAQKAPLVNVTELFMGYGYGCGLDTGGTAWCWGARTGTPAIAPEAEPFANANPSAPSGPMKYLSGFGSGGFSSQLRYVTTSGIYVLGTTIVTPTCP